MSSPGSDDNSSDVTDSEAAKCFQSYLEYNRVLRAWFVAFGIGGPALFLINDTIASRLAREGLLSRVATLFLVGAAAQVLAAFMNKVSNWGVYYGTVDYGFKRTMRYKCAFRLVTQFWIDVILDIVSVLAFGSAIWYMLTLFGRSG